MLDYIAAGVSYNRKMFITSAPSEVENYFSAEKLLELKYL
jgi:hypothetical protein